MGSFRIAAVTTTLERFAGSLEAIAELLDRGVVAHRAECGQVQRRTQRRAAATDRALAAHRINLKGRER